MASPLSLYIEDLKSVFHEGRSLPVGTFVKRKGGTYRKMRDGRWGKVQKMKVAPLPRRAKDAGRFKKKGNKTFRKTRGGAWAKVAKFRAEASEDDWKEKIIAALTKGYEADGLDGLKMAAYKLEAGGASKKMLASLLKGIVRTGELEGMKVRSSSKNGLVLLGMYADDLHKGAI